ncbi:hypothetical protein H1R20_g15643, partial [Candolleomyces eurysporus]
MDPGFAASYALWNMHHLSPYPNLTTETPPQQPPPAIMNAQVAAPLSHRPPVSLGLGSVLAASRGLYGTTQPGHFPTHPNLSITAERPPLGPGLPQQHMQNATRLGEIGRGFGPVVEPSLRNLYPSHPLQPRFETYPESTSFSAWEGQSQIRSTSLLRPPAPAAAATDAVPRPSTSQLSTNDRGQELDRQTVRHRAIPSSSPQTPYEQGARIATFDSAPSRVAVSPETRSLFHRARNFEIENFHVGDATHVTVNSSHIDGWELLLEKIATNALHDSSARYDAPKCDEDTRVEVTGEMMDWIEDRDGPKSILCMTGAAGSGKSALQQTVAERCATSDILAAAFFISSADPTRNVASAIVPTIAYQLGLKHDGFRNSVAAAVKHDRHIFSRSLQSQMDALIVRPFKNLQRSKQLDANTFPHAIFIDGLDECSGEPGTSSRLTDVEKRRLAEDRQAELLVAIHYSILNNGLPFRVLIASRPEWAIRTALEPGGHLHEAAYHIQLSDNYDASADMRRFLRRRFEIISLQIRDPQWFTEDDIETLVRAASGQFIYVAVVYKFISARRTSPAERLRIVLTWVPHEGQMARPFETLDRLYTNILLAAKNVYEAVDTHRGRDFSLLFGIFYNCSDPDYSIFFAAENLSALLGIEARGEENLISDLRSLVTLRTDSDGDLVLGVYHKSFRDFLDEESRAKDFFVSRFHVDLHLTKCCLQRILEWCPLDLDSLPREYQELPEFDRRRLQVAITKLPFSLWDKTYSAFVDELVDFTEKRGWHKLDRLLPLVYLGEGRLSVIWTDWIYYFRNHVGRLKSLKPEIAAVITGFIDKWEGDEEEWLRQMDNSGFSDTD